MVTISIRHVFTFSKKDHVWFDSLPAGQIIIKTFINESAY